VPNTLTEQSTVSVGGEETL